ncbi:hypothetical protein E8E13_000138 [Curvularia kusanoi]|uniref:Uncharacterized protein n=1 Tax=Curvularia kusanoi TaxID=90978 RepID=A0A9P4THN2_CURKU|nr:hypothetical protein E8E13_000138 [Curvularia kusanoi]
MVRRAKEETPAADKDARVFFDRRRTGVDNKIRSMIVVLSNKHHVDINVTVIYKYKDEVSMFRSQPGDGGQWFPTLTEHVPNQASYMDDDVAEAETEDDDGTDEDSQDESEDDTGVDAWETTGKQEQEDDQDTKQEFLCVEIPR